MNINVEKYVHSMSINYVDKENLLFLLSVDSETLEDWFNLVSDEDKIYAHELLSEALSFSIENQLHDTYLKESKSIIKRIMDKK